MAKKCAFGVTEGQFLGYKRSPRTEKVEAVLAMVLSKTIKEVQRLVLATGSGPMPPVLPITEVGIH